MPVIGGFQKRFEHASKNELQGSRRKQIVGICFLKRAINEIDQLFDWRGKVLNENEEGIGNCGDNLGDIGNIPR